MNAYLKDSYISTTPGVLTKQGKEGTPPYKYNDDASYIRYDGESVIVMEEA